MEEFDKYFSEKYGKDIFFDKEDMRQLIDNEMFCSIENVQTAIVNMSLVLGEILHTLEAKTPFAYQTSISFAKRTKESLDEYLEEWR